MYCQQCGTSNRAYAIVCISCRAYLHPSKPLNQYSTAKLAAVQTEQLLQNRYRLLTTLGHGGFGSVFKAQDTLVQNRVVAIKEIDLNGLQQQDRLDATDSFKREVQVLSDLHHPGLPNLYDYFINAQYWYLVMDFIAGVTLERYLEQSIGGHFLQVIDALRVCIQLCVVLDYLHTHQPPIVFRDLKPSNVMLLPDGGVRLIDFGIARYFKPGQFKDTMAFGSPGYAAPEQYGKTQTTPVADIYSLGALLHQILTGNDPCEVPFRFPSLQDYALSNIPSVPLRLLDHLISQMVELDPNKRPSSMALVRQHLTYVAEQCVV
jgi:serine/threonine protein kinase